MSGGFRAETSRFRSDLFRSGAWITGTGMLLGKPAFLEAWQAVSKRWVCLKCIDGRMFKAIASSSLEFLLPKKITFIFEM